MYSDKNKGYKQQTNYSNTIKFVSRFLKKIGDAMNKFVDSLMEEDSRTLNGAITNSTSKDFCLDLLFLAGACRNEEPVDIYKALRRSYEQDRLKTLKIIFWAGDIRGGVGERRFFKLALAWLSTYHPEDIEKNLDLIPEFSRWDVVAFLAASSDNENAFDLLIKVLKDKGDSRRGLLCKWLPRKAKQPYQKKLIKKIRETLRLSPKEYRKLLVEGTSVVETKMCKKQWDTIDFRSVPSVAFNKYTLAWRENCLESLKEFLKEVNEGKSKINASAIFPHDIIKQAIKSSKALTEAQVTQWNNLPNYLGDKTNKIIPVCDVSGSMYPDAIAVSIGLGLYISERNTGAFEDAFITFSERPMLNLLKGDISSRVGQLITADWGASTNIEAVFDVILEKGRQYQIPEEEMPEIILIISDMEFNIASRNRTNFKVIKEKYKESGYKMPKLVFWNVNGRVGNVPAQINDEVALVSGCSPSIMKTILSADLDQFNPINILNNIINSERYDCIK